MKKISIIMLLAVLAILPARANTIPAGATIYLDASQGWCCHTSYLIYLSAKDSSYVMSPVESVDGVYKFVTRFETQENFRFCYSDNAITETQKGPVGTFTQQDITGWTATRPYYIMGDGTGRWDKTATSKGETAFKSVEIRTSTDCVDSVYFATVVAEWDGAPCKIKVSGDIVSPAMTVTPQGKKMDIQFVNGKKETAGTEHSIKVQLFTDNNATQIADEKDLIFAVPETMCEEEHDLGTICIDEQSSITLSAGVTGDHYYWYEGESKTPFSEEKSVTLNTSDGDHVYKVETFKTILEPGRDLMANGGFEEETKGFTSDYNYVVNTLTREEIDKQEGTYYLKPGAIQNNLFTITSNPHSQFWRDYKPVTPHGGNYFALFDAGAKGYAWRTNTDINANLKLMKDSVYGFSFWVTSPNLPQFFNKPAVLQFVICWKDADGNLQPEVNLGPAYTTKKETAGVWEQVTADWKAPIDAEWVQIGVYDKSTDGQGNDFCLDDIMFQKVEMRSTNMAKRDVYTYTGKDCSCAGIPMYSKWGDVVFVDNSKGDYVTYQWYLENEIVAGATEQYYRFTPDQLQKEIHVEVVCKDGSILSSCPLMIGDITKGVEKDPYIAPAKKVVGRRTYWVGASLRIEQTIYDDGSTKNDKYFDL
ncbi:MAG: hypothetical protein MJZ55_00415 [Paludibacteraceae bacterium]|nr:hypothetical protein [Paludibacteraceae bacterium]